MAYNPQALQRLTNNHTGPNIWTYYDAETIANADATDYFTDAGIKGVNNGDLMIFVNTSTPGTELTTLCQILLDADGNGSLVALTAFP